MLVFDNDIFYLFIRDLVVTNGTAICILVLLDQRYLQYIGSILNLLIPVVRWFKF